MTAPVFTTSWYNYYKTVNSYIDSLENSNVVMHYFIWEETKETQEPSVNLIDCFDVVLNY